MVRANRSRRLSTNNRTLWLLCGTRSTTPEECRAKPRSALQTRRLSLETGEPLIELFNLAQHAADVSVIVARFEDSIAFPGITPFKDLNRDAPNAPLLHLHRRRTVQIDRIAT